MKTSSAVERADRRCISWLLVEVIHVRDGVKEALRPQEVSGSCAPVERQSQRTHESIDGAIALGAVILGLPPSRPKP